MTTRDLQQYVTSGGATSLRTGDGGSAAQIGGNKNQQSKKRFNRHPLSWRTGDGGSAVQIGTQFTCFTGTKKYKYTDTAAPPLKIDAFELIKRFGFDRNRAYEKIGSLSGGESVGVFFFRFF
jgi:hypothetical protein